MVVHKRFAISAPILMLLVGGAFAPALAQQRRAPASAPAASAPAASAPAAASVPADSRVPTATGDQAKADREWLTAYMLAHGGYHLSHMDALNHQFQGMAPTQLATMRKLYQQKHEATMSQQANFNRLRGQQVSMAEAHNRQAQARLDQVNTGENQAAMLEQNRLNQMHREAYQNSRQNRAASAYGAYSRGPLYGGYGYGSLHPY